MDEDLNGKAALVTGASSGIGAAVARRLRDAGVRVATLSRRGGSGALDLTADIRDRDAVVAAANRVAGELGGLDIVVANSGVGVYGPFTELSGEDADAMIDTNLKGVIHTAAATVPHLVANGGGDFISVASVAGVNAFPGEAVYNASKFGQIGFVRALDIELREHGVRCSNIAPGGVTTEFAIGTGRTAGDPDLDAMMSADDVADVVLFALTRPRTLRLMTTTFRPMSEGSWG
jgi:meso-butanediol dehydrogenase / (S,S)-butanediol dehydrogenase / diacetyl reductase